MRLEKLSLHVVEVTISLSNYNDDQPKDSKRKVISIKDISEMNQSKSKSMKEQTEVYQGDMQEEISRQKKEITSLQEKKAILLEEMKASIQKEKESWLKTKEQEREAAQQIGYKTGYDAGEEQAMKSYEQQLSEANNIVESAKADYFQTIAKHEKTMIQLAITTAEKILHEKLEEDKHYFTKILKEAMNDIKGRSEVVIYVSPSNYEFVMNRKEELELILEEGGIISVYVDQKMNQGDCVIKHSFGQVDVGIDVQLKQIKVALEEKLSENQ